MENINKKLRISGTFLGAIAVILGAFGAHGLEKVLDADALSSFEVGVRYQFYHVFVLWGVSLFALSEKTKKLIFWLVVTGIICFSGSIYLLATNAITVINFKAIAPITPIGGGLLIAGWVVLFISFLKRRSDI